MKPYRCNCPSGIHHCNTHYFESIAVYDNAGTEVYDVASQSYAEAFQRLVASDSNFGRRQAASVFAYPSLLLWDEQKTTAQCFIYTRRPVINMYGECNVAYFIKTTKNNSRETYVFLPKMYPT